MDAACFAHLSDQQLTNEVFRLAASERRATADLIASLGEFDRRRLFLPAGFSSMFTYCTKHLCLGEGAAYRRIEAARLCRRFPAALGLLADGAVTLTTLALLAPHLTDANHLDVLTRAIRKSKRDVEILVATLSPQPDVPTTLRRLPQARPGSGSVAGLNLASKVPEPSPCRVLPLRPAQRPVVVPLAPERFKLQITMSRETHDTLREVQDLIRHSVPSGDAAIIVARALALLRDHLLRRKTGRLLREPAAGAAAHSSLKGGRFAAATHDASSP